MTTSADVGGWTVGADDMVERIAGHELQRYVVEQFGDGDAVLVPDETGYLNKGNTSAGVGRQHSGTAGRIDNGQIGVFLGCASRHGRVLLDRALHLPKGWAQDRRRAKAWTDRPWGDPAPGAALPSQPPRKIVVAETRRGSRPRFACWTGYTSPPARRRSSRRRTEP